MFKRMLLMTTMSISFATNIYDAPNAEANTLSEVDPQHEYVITTQDWVQVVDKTTNQTGWAKLSELKSALTSNSQWSFAWTTTTKGNNQSMHYRPVTEKDIKNHVQEAHKQHKRIMSQFNSFWKELDNSFEDIMAVDTEHQA